MRPTKLGYVALVMFMAFGCSKLSFFSPSCTGDNCNASASKNDPQPTPTPTPTPTPSPSPTVDPCGGPVTGVNTSGPTLVANGTEFKVDVTPVSSVGELEGVLDYCNAKRRVRIISLTSNLRCVGDCTSFGPRFVAQGVGPFQIDLLVDTETGTFAGTVTR